MSKRSKIIEYISKLTDQQITDIYGFLHKIDWEGPDYYYSSYTTVSMCRQFTDFGAYGANAMVEFNDVP